MKIEQPFPQPESVHSLWPRSWKSVFVSLDPWFGDRLKALLDSNLSFAAFCAALLILFIWNSHVAEKKARLADSYRLEIKELKSEYMTLSARLSTRRQQSEISRFADSLGLRLPDEPPYKLILSRP